MPVRERVLAISVRATGMGMALFEDDAPILALVSQTAGSGSYPVRKATLVKWLERFQPDIVVFENTASARRKGRRQRDALRHLARAARTFPCAVRIVDRTQSHANKFQEAQSLAQSFPVLRDRVPRKPRIWEGEPHFVALFEAVAIGRIALEHAGVDANETSHV